jgi:hypothetical protein
MKLYAMKIVEAFPLLKNETCVKAIPLIKEKFRVGGVVFLSNTN